MRWVLYSGLFFCFLLSQVSCGGSSDTQADANYILLTEEDNGSTVDISIESEIVIELESNHSTGYRWEQMNPDGNFIYQESESVYVANEGCDEMDGCGGVDQFTFKARHTGQGAVSLIYHRVDEEAIDQFDIDVIVTE